MVRSERTAYHIQTKFVMANNMKHGKGRSMQASEKTVDGFRFLPPVWPPIDSLIPDRGFKEHPYPLPSPVRQLYPRYERRYQPEDRPAF
jgi:hypothetical protein